MVPVELEVLDNQLASATEYLDFGILTTVGQKSSQHLWLFNSGNDDLQVLDASLSEPDSSTLVNILDHSLPAGRNTPIALVEYKAGMKQGRFNGIILVSTSHPIHSLSIVRIPFTVAIVYGGVGFNRSMATFIVSSDDVGVREVPFPLVNYNALPMTLLSASVSTCEQIFDLHPLVYSNVTSLSIWNTVTIVFNMEKAKKVSSRFPLTCTLDVNTNVSLHRIPLHVTNGWLKTIFYEEDIEEDLINNEKIFSISLGDLSAVEPRPFEFTLSNPSAIAIPIVLTSFKSNRVVQICIEKPISSSSTLSKNNASMSSSYGIPIPSSITTTTTTTSSLSSDTDVFNNNGVATDMNEIKCYKSSSRRFPISRHFIPSWHTLKMSIQFSSTMKDVIENEMNEALLRLSTPYEKLAIKLNYESVTGALISAVEPGSQTIVLGKSHDISVSTASSFPYDIFVTETALSSASKLSYLAKTISHLISPSALLSDTDDSATAVDRGICSIRVVPLVSSCINNAPLSSSFALSHCMKLLLESITLPAIALQTEMSRLIGIMTEIESTIIADQMITAHTLTRSLQQGWVRLFTMGVPLPDISLSIESPQTLHTITIRNVSVLTPLDLLPSRTVFDLPIVRADQAALFYFRIHNPFSVPIAFSLYNDGTDLLTVVGGASNGGKKSYLVGHYTPHDTTTIAGNAVFDDEDGVAEGAKYITKEGCILKDANTPLASAFGSCTMMSPSPSSQPTTLYRRLPLILKHPLRMIEAIQVKSEGSETAKLRKLMTEREQIFITLVPANVTIVAPPHHSILLGPIAASPPSNSETMLASYYIKNNFTGIERVDIRVRCGSPR